MDDLTFIIYFSGPNLACEFNLHSLPKKEKKKKEKKKKIRHLHPDIILDRLKPIVYVHKLDRIVEIVRILLRQRHLFNDFRLFAGEVEFM